MKARPKELSHYSTVNIKKYNLKLIYKHNRTALFNIHKCNVLEKKTIINTLWQWGCDWALAEDAGKPWLFSPVSEISLSSTNSWNKLARVSGICKRNVCGWSCRSKAWCGIYWGGDAGVAIDISSMWGLCLSTLCSNSPRGFPLRAVAWGDSEAWLWPSESNWWSVNPA